MESNTTASKPKPSTSALLSSTKVVAGAAKSALAHESGKIDKAQVAGAGADLLGAAKHYGKLEDKKLGKYIDQAETYLHKYHHSHPAGAAAHDHTTTSTTAHGSSSSNNSHNSDNSGTTAHGSSSSNNSHSDNSGGIGSGYGDYIKLAQGLLKKH